MIIKVLLIFYENSNVKIFVLKQHNYCIFLYYLLCSYAANQSYLTHSCMSLCIDWSLITYFLIMDYLYNI